MDELGLLWEDISTIVGEVFALLPRPSGGEAAQLYEDIKPFLRSLPSLLVSNFLYFFVPLFLSILALLLALAHEKARQGKSKTVLLTGPSGAGKTGLFAKARLLSSAPSSAPALPPPPQGENEATQVHTQR
jgi:hypothetical protein